MKYGIILLTLLVLTGCNGEAKTESDEKEKNESKWSDKAELESIFERDLKDMIAAFNAGDYVTGTDYMPEEVFNYASKEQMVSQFETIENMGMSMSYLEFDLKDISKVVFHEGKYYSRILSSSKSKIVFNEYARYLMDEFAGEYDDSESTIQRDSDSSLILLSNDINYAINDEDSEIWKYLRSDKQMKVIVNRIVPTQVRIALD